MDVVCINNHRQEHCLTIGKTYNDAYITGSFYVIIDDYNISNQFYHTTRFLSPEQYREQTINQILDDSVEDSVAPISAR
jgi:hypothetical protein